MQVVISGVTITLSYVDKEVTLNAGDIAEVYSVIDKQRQTIGPLTPAPNNFGQSVPYVAPTPRFIIIIQLKQGRGGIESFYLDDVTNQAGWTNDQTGADQAVADIRAAMPGSSVPGGVSDVTATYPLQSTGGATPDISADTSNGGNFDADAGKIPVFGDEGQLKASVIDSVTPGFNVEASGVATALQVTSNSGPAIAVNSNTGSLLSGSTGDVAAVAVQNSSAVAPVLDIQNNDAGPVAHMHGSDGTGLIVEQDGGFSWDSATGQATARAGLGLPEVWNALVYTDGVGGASVTVLGLNTIGAIVAADTSGTGVTVTLTLAGAFPSGKTLVLCGSPGFDTNNDTGIVAANRTSSDIITLETIGGFQINGCPVKIERYP